MILFKKKQAGGTLGDLGNVTPVNSGLTTGLLSLLGGAADAAMQYGLGKLEDKKPQNINMKKVMQSMPSTSISGTLSQGFDPLAGATKTQFFKKGGKSGIYIKPSKRGSFTKWCKSQGYDGVTSECISKGKNSPNAAIRKKANFAANARKWN